MEDIQHHDIPIYNFPYDVEEDDEETIQENIELRVRLLAHYSYSRLKVDFQRHSYPSPSSVPRRKSILTERLSAPGYIPGAWLKSTILSTRTLVV